MKGDKTYSIIHAKCPVCQEGDVFESKQIYNLKEFDKMHENCTICNHKYEIENGFWYGAMYVSYALTVAFSVATFILTYLFYPSASVWVYIGMIVLSLLVLAPITFRLSRLIWMNFFSSYDPLKAKQI
jgi:uncharacterized protein (DUF983 family)